MVQEAGHKGDNALVDILIKFFEERGFKIKCKYADPGCSWDAGLKLNHPPGDSGWSRVRELTIFGNIVKMEDNTFDACNPEFFDKLQHLVDNPNDNIMFKLLHEATGSIRYKDNKTEIGIDFKCPDSSTDRASASGAEDEGSSPSRGDIPLRLRNPPKWEPVDGESGEVDIGNGMKMLWQTKVFKEKKEEEK